MTANFEVKFYFSVGCVMKSFEGNSIYFLNGPITASFSIYFHLFNMSQFKLIQEWMVWPDWLIIIQVFVHLKQWLWLFNSLHKKNVCQKSVKDWLRSSCVRFDWRTTSCATTTALVPASDWCSSQRGSSWDRRTWVRSQSLPILLIEKELWAEKSQLHKARVFLTINLILSDAFNLLVLSR